MSGVKVMRALRNGTGPQMAFWERRDDEHERPWTAGKESGRWYPEAEAAALDAVAEASKRWRVASDQFDPSSFRSASDLASARAAVITAVDALDAARHAS